MCEAVRRTRQGSKVCKACGAEIPTPDKKANYKLPKLTNCRLTRVLFRLTIMSFRLNKVLCRLTGMDGMPRGWPCTL